MMALAAFSFMLIACGDKQASQEQNAENKSETAKEDNTSAEKTDDAATEEDGFIKEDELHQLSEISRVWASKSLTGIATDKTIDIERFALAFCKEYPTFKPNKAISDYLEAPTKYDEEKSLFHIDNQKKNGFLACRLMTEYDWSTECCYWNRSNGHKLVAFWLSESLESYTKDEHLLAFYDYDPATDTMTPEPILSKKVEDAMSSYDAYTIKLPDEGKDIDLIGHKINLEEDCYDNTCYLLRWNGNDFKMEEVIE